LSYLPLYWGNLFQDYISHCSKWIISPTMCFLWKKMFIIYYVTKLDKIELPFTIVIIPMVANDIGAGRGLSGWVVKWLRTLSSYHKSNNKTGIRSPVTYYKRKGFQTYIHGWGSYWSVLASLSPPPNKSGSHISYNCWMWK